MWVKVRQVIRDKRMGLVVLGVVAIGCMMFTYQKGYGQGQGFRRGLGLRTVGGPGGNAGTLSYLPAEPVLGEVAENRAR